ncbi:S8 family serine peptidase [Actinomycetes bacterium KLBMP 9797]
MTGDKVTLAPGGDNHAAVRPAKGREKIGFAVYRQGDALYVIPRDAQRLVQTGKLDRRLFDVAGLAKAGYHDAARDTLPLIVKYGAARRAVHGAQVTRELAAIDGVAITVHKEQSSAAWSTLAVAEKVWLDGLRRISLDQSVPQIGAPAAWQSGYTGQGITVAVLDTGVDGEHPDLAGKVAESRNFSEAEDGDTVGHGTHVASIIAGSGAASDGKYRGVAPDARLISGKVCESSFCTESAILAGMQWAAAEARATVINMSLGGTDSPEIDPLEEAVNTLTAEHGTLFAIAAGNSGPGNGTVDSPGSAEAALTVGAVDKSEELADFSSRGPRAGDDGMKPDITAPGVDIVAAKGSGTDIGEPVGSAYTTLSGTSMATPHVAGAAAILAQARPGWKAAQLKAALTASARPNPALTGFQQGAGRVDVARAITQTVTTDPAGTSFGRPFWPHNDDEPVTRTVTYRNTGTSDVTLDLATRIVGPTGAAAPAGMFVLSAPRVTVPAGGTAQVTVTADTRVAGPDGLYSGHLVATGGDAVVTTPLGVHKEVESYNLTVTHIDQTGAPGLLGLTVAVGLDAEFWGWLYDEEDGTVTARLPKGRYGLSTFIDRERAENEYDSSFQVRPTFNLTKDTSLTVDARQGKPVRTTIPERSAAPALIDITAAHVTEFGWFGAGIWASDFEGLTTAHHGPALPAEEFSSYVASQWAKPGPDGDFADSPYFYAVSEGIPGRLPTGYTRNYRASELATVRQHFAAGPAGLFAERAVFPILEPDMGASAAVLPVDLPSSRVEYVNTQGVRWGGDLWLGVPDEEGFLEPQMLFVQDLKSYQAGRVYRDEWAAAPLGPAFWPDGSIARLGDEIFVDLALYGDRAGHPGLSVTDASRTALYRNGELVSETDCSGCGMFEVPAGRANYRLEVADSRSIGDLTTQVSAAWTFRSGHVAGEEPAYPPASVVRFTPKLDAAHAAPAGAAFEIPVSVLRQPGAPSAGVKRLSVQVSYDDGKTWRAASLRKVGDEWIASVRHPQGAGFVSLRATAVDTGGNTVTQTIIHAYRLK